MCICIFTEDLYINKFKIYFTSLRIILWMVLWHGISVSQSPPISTEGLLSHQTPRSAHCSRVWLTHSWQDSALQMTQRNYKTLSYHRHEPKTQTCCGLILSKKPDLRAQSESALSSLIVIWSLWWARITPQHKGVCREHTLRCECLESRALPPRSQQMPAVQWPSGTESIPGVQPDCWVCPSPSLSVQTFLMAQITFVLPPRSLYHQII